MKKLHIKSFGCQMNVYDSERMADLLVPLGYELTDHAESADLVILNTCHIREKAADKVYSELGRLHLEKKHHAEQGERMVLAVGGCVAQAEGAEIFRRAPYVDLVFGPQTYHRLPEMIARAHRDSGRVLDTDFPSKSKFDALPAPARQDGFSAFLTVQEGCDRFCTFCVVPYTRGAEFSRPAEQVLGEARGLVEAGVKEITLLGQNVNAYHGEGKDGREWKLGRLIETLAGIDGLDRIRYTTSYPADIDEELIAAHRDVPALAPYLHLPLQSGSDRILKAMNRRHSATDYRRLVDRLCDARPDLALSSDFIVGFPGETEADFRQTLALIEDVGFIQTYSFKYSPRPGTPAAALADQVAEPVKSARLSELQDRLNAQQRAFNESCVGVSMSVLLENHGRHSGQLVGRSPYMQAVHAEAPIDRLGTFAELEITSAHGNSLGARLADGSEAEANKRRLTG